MVAAEVARRQKANQLIPVALATALIAGESRKLWHCAGQSETDPRVSFDAGLPAVVTGGNDELAVRDSVVGQHVIPNRIPSRNFVEVRESVFVRPGAATRFESLQTENG